VYTTPWHKELTHSPILFSSLSDKGVDAEEAKARINKDMPGLHVIVLSKVRTEKKKGESACVFLIPSVFSKRRSAPARVCVDCVFSLCLFVYLGSMCESVTFFSLQR